MCSEVCMYQLEVGFALGWIAQFDYLLAWGCRICGGALEKRLFIKISIQGPVVALWTVIEAQDSALAQGGLKEGCAKQENYMPSSGRGIDGNC